MLFRFFICICFFLTIQIHIKYFPYIFFYLPQSLHHFGMIRRKIRKAMNIYIINVHDSQYKCFCNHTLCFHVSILYSSYLYYNDCFNIPFRILWCYSLCMTQRFFLCEYLRPHICWKNVTDLWTNCKAHHLFIFIIFMLVHFYFYYFYCVVVKLKEIEFATSGTTIGCIYVDWILYVFINVEFL